MLMPTSRRHWSLWSQSHGSSEWGIEDFLLFWSWTSSTWAFGAEHRGAFEQWRMDLHLNSFQWKKKQQFIVFLCLKEFSMLKQNQRFTWRYSRCVWDNKIIDFFFFLQLLNCHFWLSCNGGPTVIICECNLLAVVTWSSAEEQRVTARSFPCAQLIVIKKRERSLLIKLSLLLLPSS